jgi:FkbM family methyltransferase
VKRILQAALARLGYEIRRLPGSFPADPFEAQRELLRLVGCEAPTIFDIGTHRGETVASYRATFPGGRVVGFEATPATAEATAERFRGDPGVEIVQCAIADAPGRRRFRVNRLDYTSSLLDRPSSGARYFPSSDELSAEIEVEVTTIDAAAAELDAVQILKLDIQGAELLAFRGAGETLANKGVHCIFTEMLVAPTYEGAPRFHEVWRFLSEQGFSLFDLYGLQNADDGQLIWGDALFVGPEVRAELDRRTPVRQSV